MKFQLGADNLFNYKDPDRIPNLFGRNLYITINYKLIKNEIMKTWYLLLGIGIISSLLSCSDDDPITGVNIKTVNINNLAADPVIYDPITGKTSWNGSIYLISIF